MSSHLKAALRHLAAYASGLLFRLVARPICYAIRRQRDLTAKPRLVWGPVPIISNKYWSNALAEGGWTSRTLTYPHFATINQRHDFDLYLYELVRWPFLATWFKATLGPYVDFVYALRHFDVFHHPYSGGFLARTPMWHREAQWLALAGKKVVILPFGGDFYMYSRVIDPSLRHGLLLSYPQPARDETLIAERVAYWTRHADAVIPGFQIDGLGRWDALPFSAVTIDTALWPVKSTYSPHDGRSGPVKILHTPNHRGFKGSEFLIAAVEKLQAEGLLIDLLLIEKTPNEEVRRLMLEEADILAEQFIATAYALSGIEGMACGLPVLSNLEHEAYTRVFRRYSYLNECPILSTTPESLVDHLRALVTHPTLREQLGRAGRHYVEKYHSPATARYLFGSLYERIWHGGEVDLGRLFHPLLSDYNRQGGAVDHPLVENRLPASGGLSPT